MLKVSGITKSFSNGTTVHVLRGVNFEVNGGELVAVSGSNGSGKSTLLNIIAGRLAPDQGQVHLGGVDVTLTPAHVRAKTLGLVHQDSHKGLAVEVSVGELIGTALRRNSLLRLCAPRPDEALEALMTCYPGCRELLGFYARRRTTPTHSLSGGERQLLALLVALVGDSQLLLLDEYRANLDPERAGAADELIRGFTNAGGSALAVAHEREWHRAVPDRILHLVDGTVDDERKI